jgi:hypothetical protein
MHAGGESKWVRRRRALEAFIGLSVLATLLLGAGGFVFGGLTQPELHGSLAAAEHQAKCDPAGLWGATDLIYRMLLLFELGEGGLLVRECYASPLLAVARFTGPLAIYAGLIRLLWGFIGDGWARWRLSRLSGHTIVVGLGERGRAFVDDAAPGAPIVAVDRHADDDMRSFMEHQRGLLVGGDGRHPDILRLVRAPQAKVILAASGDDETNLRIADAATAAGAAGADLRVMVADPLVRRSLAASPSGGRLDVLSLEELAARAFTDRTRLFEIAELMGAPGLHVVLAGSGRLQAAMAAQLLRASVFPGHAKPVLTLLAPEPEAVADELCLAYPGMSDVAVLRPLAFDPERQLLDEGMAVRIAAPGAVTAILACGRDGKEAFKPALALRDGLRRLGGWRAPVFFAAVSPESLAAFTLPFDSPRLGEVFEPFPISASLCAWRAIAAIDRSAMAFHENYRQAHGEISRDGQAASSTVEALRPWADLPATYKRSNRRAADHVPAKLAAAGCWTPPGVPVLPSDLDLVQDDLEMLARLEHDAWATDRRLEGWRPGEVRDDGALVHDCLVDFDDLAPPTQSLDRAQVVSLNGGMLSRSRLTAAAAEPGVVRRDLHLGVIGSLSLDAAEAEAWEAFVGRWLAGVLLPAAADRFITLVSPLAPGGDLIAVRKAISVLADSGRPWRLLVPQAVSYVEVLADFEGRWAAGAAGLPELSRSDWSEARTALREAAESVSRANPANRIVPLSVAPKETPTRGYQRQSAYVARRCDILLARPKDMSRKPGGVSETLAWREDPGLIPDEVDVRARPRRHIPAVAPEVVAPA